jgi:hypothetical protein
VRQGVHRCFGAIAPRVARKLWLRHDHRSKYMSGDFQDEIECLGIEASPSFMREPEGANCGQAGTSIVSAPGRRSAIRSITK